MGSRRWSQTIIKIGSVRACLCARVVTKPQTKERDTAEIIFTSLHWNHTLATQGCLEPNRQRPHAAQICARCPTGCERHHKSSCMCVWCENWIGSQCLLQTSHQCNTRSTMGRGRRATHCRPRRPDNAKRLPIVNRLLRWMWCPKS